MRVFDSTIQNSLDADYQREAWLVKLDFPGGTIYSTTADKSLTHDGDTYSPDGLLLSIDLLTERADAKVQTADLGLAPTTALFDRLDDDYQLSLVEVFWASLDDDHAINDEAIKVAQYYMSHHTIRAEEGQQTVSLTCYSRTLPYRRTYGVLSSGVDQKARHATDDAMDFTDKILDRELSWGGMTKRDTAGMGGAGDPRFTGHPQRTLEDVRNAIRRTFEGR